MSTPTGATTLYLFRHGATGWNADGRWAGRAEMPLSDLGRLQVERLAARLAALPGPWAAAFASPLGRARESAALVAARLGTRVEVDPRLLEVSYGEWEGKTPGDVQATPGGARRYAEWEARPARVAPPGGETASDTLERIVAFARDLVHRFPGGQVVACGHRTTNRILLAHALGLPLDEFRRGVPQDNAALNVLRLHADGRLEALAVNDTAHLEGLPRVEGVAGGGG